MTYRLYIYGYPTCHERCAKSYFMVLWDIGDRFETGFKLGLN